MPRGADIQKWKAEGFYETIRKNPNMTNEELGRRFDLAENTCKKMRRYKTVEEWQEAKKAKAERANERRTAAREKAATAARVPEVTTCAEEQVPGQMEMELKPAGKQVEEKPEMSEAVKMMRLVAGKANELDTTMQQGMERIAIKLDKIRDMLGQLLRAWAG